MKRKVFKVGTIGKVSVAPVCVCLCVCVGGQRTSKHWENLGSGLIEKMLQSAHNTLLLWHSWPKNVNKRKRDRERERSGIGDWKWWIDLCTRVLGLLFCLLPIHNHHQHHRQETWTHMKWGRCKGSELLAHIFIHLYICNIYSYDMSVPLAVPLSAFHAQKTLCNNPSVVKQIFTNILQSEETSQ